MTITVDEQIRLEVIAPHHAAGLLEVVNANREHLAQYLPWVGAMQTVDDFARYIQLCEQKTADKLEISFVIYRQDTLVGRIGLHHIQPANKSGAIGYWLAKTAEGSGIMINSCRKLIEYGFSVLQLNRIEIKAAVQNIKSQAIPQKLGLFREGVLRESEWVNGDFFDIVVYSVLKREWEKQQ